MAELAELHRMIGDVKEALGEMRGQSREIVHAVNNIQTAMQSVGRELASMQHHATEIDNLKVRMAAIEAIQNRTHGAWSLARILPGAITGIVAFFAAHLSGIKP